MQLPLGTVLPSLWEGAPLQTLLLLSAILLILASYLQRKRRQANYPPGPSPLPLLGNFFQIDFKKPQVAFQEFVRKYGNVFCMELGSFTFVFVTGMPLIKEVLVNQDQVFIDRPQSVLRSYAFKSSGLIMSEGQAWKHQRRFTLMTLKNFGLGKRTLEHRIQEEAMYLTEAIREEKGQPFDPHLQINNAVSNIICSITFGHRFEYHDSQFRELLMSLDEVTVLEARWECQLFDTFPWIMRFLPGPHQKFFREWKKLESFVVNVIKQHKEDQNSEEAQDFIDAYLKELSKDNISSSFNEDNLVCCTLDLFFAGTETTSTILRWALLYMALYPEIQDKIQAEIDRVIGQSRQPTMADRENMPYTNAAIHEVLRMGNILPVNVPRVARVDTTVAGYYVPKGTMLLTNLTALHRDPKVWATPETFNPEHFLENGQFTKREAFLPFSAGKRVCLGEQLARAELFIFFTCLLQRFTFQAPPDTQLSLDFRAGLTISPVPYKICALPRKTHLNFGL
ncbi:cytochrome P450 2J2-like isoform X1 [Monodelphis domestica]|uniref:cytochrome P450 2J2-like isoform X1 n=2 Tax=Monodelphis domestica TaxID=13616 RepID=UPI0024E1BB08|nr:cytochrome P450 2J2-like isoform X1 [Monodelphis domestica]